LRWQCHYWQANQIHWYSHLRGFIHLRGETVYAESSAHVQALLQAAADDAESLEHDDDGQALALMQEDVADANSSISEMSLGCLDGLDSSLDSLD